MPYSPPDELMRQLLEEDKYQKCLDVLTKFENNKENSIVDQVAGKLLKGYKEN
jgi:hypothetical protein